jgi:plastocyanin
MRIALLALALAAAPLAVALPGACAEPCIIESDSLGYRPPVVTIASGTSVVWTTLDVTHVSVDGLNAGDADLCFAAIAQEGEPSLPVRFDLAAGQLVATTGEESLVCENAVIRASAATVPYFCDLHPTMRGVLVVTG